MNLLSSCFKEKKQVFGIHDKIKFEEFKKLNLDDSHVNLLNPKFSTKQEYTTIINSWRAFHQKVNTILSDNNFTWEIPDSTITVFNKIYFSKNGDVNYFLVNIINEKVTDSTKNIYIKLLENNLDKLNIDVVRENQFAQCGKVKYKNYE